MRCGAGESFEGDFLAFDDGVLAHFVARVPLIPSFSALLLSLLRYRWFIVVGL